MAKRNDPTSALQRTTGFVAVFRFVYSLVKSGVKGADPASIIEFNNKIQHMGSP